MTPFTQVWTPVDFEADGKQCDWLRVPHSTDLSGYGVIPVPVVCIKNGDGPTALLVAGSHGDEYEGQLALARLAREVDWRDIRGRIIMLPSLNMPATAAGRRVSPLDDGNLNRLFPGNPVGGPTSMIAHYVSTVLLKLADFVIDLHAGGRSSDYLPCALIREGRDQNEQKAVIELAKIFGAPITSVSDGSGGGGATTLSATAQSLGIPALTTELGGHATLSKEGLNVAITGLWRVLEHYQIATGSGVTPAPATRFMQVQGRGAFVYTMNNGMFEPAAELGETVRDGQIAGHIHAIDQPWRAPEPIRFTQDGLVACRRALSITAPGDCLYKLLADVALT